MRNFIFSAALGAALQLGGTSVAQTVEGVSDINLVSKEITRIQFDCPSEQKKKIQTSDIRANAQNSNKANCWIELDKDHMNVMGLQSINKADIKRHWYVLSRDWGGCNINNWFFAYKSPSDELKLLRMRKRDCGWKNSKIGEEESLAINTWLSY